MTTPFKQAVRHRFDAAAEVYDRLAHIQRDAAQCLMNTLPPPPAGRWLDAGCGTGQAATLLAQRMGEPGVALDFSPAMARAAARRTAQVVCADLEHLPFSDGTFKLYWSSLAWQWCDLNRAVNEATRVLAPGGLLRVGTLGPQTLHELRDAFAGLDRAHHVLDFQPPEALTHAAHATGLTHITVACHTLTAWQPDTATVLRELKALGASEVASRRQGLMGRETWRTLQSRYEQHRTPAGLPVTYDLVLLTARRAP